jgi:outer membrane protein assembly factor BamB
MKKRLIFSIVFIAILYFGSLNVLAQNNWPQWRGPDANGLLLSGDPPIEFGENKNLEWKIELPGKGNSTPIIWENQLYILTAIPTDKTVKVDKKEEEGRRGPGGISTDKVQSFEVLSIDRQSGKILWQTKVHEEHPEDNTHELGSWASNSPVTDGEHVWAYFGSRGLYCLDMSGNVLWERDFGHMQKVMSFGEGSSPLVYDDKLYIVWDHEGDSYMYAVDAKTGQDVWTKSRDEGSSWATPFLVEVNGQPQIVVAATNRIRAYDPDTGDVIWQCGGLTRNVIPQPLVRNNIIYLTSGFRGAALLAIDLTKANSDVTGTDAIVWQHDEETPYTPSPLMIDDLYYMLRGNNASLSCLKADDGTVLYTKEKLEGGGNIYASLVGVKDRFYVPCENGNFFVVKHGSEFAVIAQNKLEDEFIASPAIIGDKMYVRGRAYLYCLSEK